LGGKRTITQRAPWAISFGFGLLHGLGFAGALAEVGLPRDEIPTALFAFNVGIELGQLAFVAVVLAGCAAFRAIPAPYSKRFEISTAYAIGSIAIYWFLERATAAGGKLLSQAAIGI